MKLLILLCALAAVYTAKLEGFESFTTTQRLSSTNAPQQLYSVPTNNRFSGVSNNLESGFSGSSAQTAPQNDQSFSGLSTQRFPITPSQSSIQQDTTSQFVSGVTSETFNNPTIHSSARPSGQSSNKFSSPSSRVQPNQSYPDSSRQSHGSNVQPPNRDSGTSTQGSSAVSQQYSRPSTQTATAPAHQLLNGVSASLNQDQRAVPTQSSTQQYTNPSESTSSLSGQNFNQHGFTQTQASQRLEPQQQVITTVESSQQSFDGIPIQAIQEQPAQSIQSQPTSNRHSHDSLSAPIHQAQNNQPRESYSAPSTQSSRLTGQSFNGISGQTQAQSTNLGTSTQTASTERGQSQNNFRGSSHTQSYSAPSAQSLNGISVQGHHSQSTPSGTTTQQVSTTRGQAQNNFPTTPQIQSIPSTHASQPSVQEDYSSSEQSILGFNNQINSRVHHQADFDSNGAAHSQNFDNEFHGENVNGHSIIADNERNCAEGEVRHVDGTCVVPEVERKVFVYAAPEQELGTRTGPQPEIPLPKEEHNIIFIRAPEGGAGGDPIIIPPPQKKHIIYVLNKESENQEQRVIEIPAPASKSPEVFFVNYADGENPTLPGGIDFETALNSAIEAEGQLIGGANRNSEAQHNSGSFGIGNNFNEQSRDNAGVINENNFNNNNNNNNVAFGNPIGTATHVDANTSSGILTNGNNFATNPANANNGFNRFNAGSVSQTNNGGLSVVVDSGEDFQENAHFVGNRGNPSRNFVSAAVPTPSAPSGFYSTP